MSRMEGAMASGNVFTAEYLQRLAVEDEPGGAAEGELAGPWQVVETDAGGWEVVRLWGGSGGAGPRVSATDRETALLFAATLPAVGRAHFFRTGEPPEGGRLRVECDGQVVAALTGLGEEAVAAVHVAACLARSPWALALLVQAAGPAVQREVGEILFQGG